MPIAEMFVAKDDTETHRVCGTCGKLKELEAFYKDGKNSEGKPRYRRDCRDCYKSARIMEAKMKGMNNNGKKS